MREGLASSSCCCNHGSIQDTCGLRHTSVPHMPFVMPPACHNASNWQPMNTGLYRCISSVSHRCWSKRSENSALDTKSYNRICSQRGWRWKRDRLGWNTRYVWHSEFPIATVSPHVHVRTFIQKITRCWQYSLFSVQGLRFHVHWLKRPGR